MDLTFILCSIDFMTCFTDCDISLSLNGLYDDTRALGKRGYLVIIRDNFC